MLILWTKYPDFYLKLDNVNTSPDVGVIGFDDENEHYMYFDATSLMYSDEDEYGANPVRHTISTTAIKMFLI